VLDGWSGAEQCDAELIMFCVIDLYSRWFNVFGPSLNLVSVFLCWGFTPLGFIASMHGASAYGLTLLLRVFRNISHTTTLV
jgi:hypothetical protein